MATVGGCMPQRTRVRLRQPLLEFTRGRLTEGLLREHVLKSNGDRVARAPDGPEFGTGEYIAVAAPEVGNGSAVGSAVLPVLTHAFRAVRPLPC